MSEPPAFAVRPAGPSDAGSMREVATEAYQRYVNRIGRRPRPMTADYDRIAKSGHAWVAEQDGRVVGLLALKPADDHMLRENVVVAPHAQGLGAGARLLQAAEEQAPPSLGVVGGVLKNRSRSRRRSAIRLVCDWRDSAAA